MSYKLQLNDLGGVAGALADPDNPGEAAGSVGVLRGDLVEQFADHERLVRELREDGPAGCQVASLRESDHTLDLPPNLLRLGLRRPDLFIAQHRNRQVP